jgi:hypothetical protein
MPIYFRKRGRCSASGFASARRCRQCSHNTRGGFYSQSKIPIQTPLAIRIRSLGVLRGGVVESLLLLAAHVPEGHVLHERRRRNEPLQVTWMEGRGEARGWEEISARTCATKSIGLSQTLTPTKQQWTNLCTIHAACPWL